MAVNVDRTAYLELTTSDVDAADAFAFWREALNSTIVGLRAEPLGESVFVGRLEHVPCGQIALTTVHATGKRVHRTKTLISQDPVDCLLVSIQLRGVGAIEQDGRTALLAAGSMAFCDSTRPYSLRFEGPHSHLVVQVPKSLVTVRSTRQVTARAMDPSTIGGCVAAFLSALPDSALADPRATATLVPHAIGLVSAAASRMAGVHPDEDSLDALTRQRITDFLQQNLTDSSITASDVARFCNVSRRSLYRLVGGDGVAGRLRRLRVERSRLLLTTDVDRPVAAIGAACGFDSESGFYRAFKQVTGETPSAYRSRASHSHGAPAMGRVRAVDTENSAR